MDFKKQRFYCTLFDSNYLIRGLALYRSLSQVSESFILYILCMDDESFSILNEMNLDSVRLITLTEFEDKDLLSIKNERSVAEYCWTCAPCLPSYIFAKQHEVSFLTYLDADLLFFSSPEAIYDEIGSASSVIVPHRFSEKFSESVVNGKYNVQWVSFRRDENGLATLRWWRDRCIEWCFYRLEDGKMGDQKYLDYWSEKFSGVHELEHIGAGLAPWNYSNYLISQKVGDIYVNELPLIFYHFHGYKALQSGDLMEMPSVYYELNKFPAIIYEKYEAALNDARIMVLEKFPFFLKTFDYVKDHTSTTQSIKKRWFKNFSFSRKVN